MARKNCIRTSSKERSDTKSENLAVVLVFGSEIPICRVKMRTPQNVFFSKCHTHLSPVKQYIFKFFIFAFLFYCGPILNLCTSIQTCREIKHDVGWDSADEGAWTPDKITTVYLWYTNTEYNKKKVKINSFVHTKNI